jgi:hypothetical protein
MVDESLDRDRESLVESVIDAVNNGLLAYCKMNIESPDLAEGFRSSPQRTRAICLFL